MSLDEVSKRIIKIALELNDRVLGMISEIWINEVDLKEIRESTKSIYDLEIFIRETDQMIDDLPDERRRKYLKEILNSLQFQIQNNSENDITYNNFSKNTFGYEIQRVTSYEIDQIQTQISKLELEIGLSRQEVFLKNSIDEHEKIAEFFEVLIERSKRNIPLHILNFPDKGFEIEVVNNKPWSAFNWHIAPFKSKLSINIDVDLTKFDFEDLAYHEGYGGHHAELCNKDRLLLEGRGEHGLVIVYSPQVFISEAIAVGCSYLFGGISQDKEKQLMWTYNRLTFCLQNLATHMYFDDKKNINEINEMLSKYAVSNKTRENIINFSTDKIFGRYAPVYFSAFDFFMEIYTKRKNKDKLISILFTQPCTPSLISKEYDKY